MNDRAAIFEEAFRARGGDDVVGLARLQYLGRLLKATEVSRDEAERVDLGEVAWGFESLGVTAARSEAGDARVAELFERAFHLRAARVADEVPPRPIDLWMLAVSGVLAQRQPELRLLLLRLDWAATLEDHATDPWDKRLWLHSVRALLLLARKAGPWTDVEEALRALRTLSAMQAAAEPEFLATAGADTPLDPIRQKLLGLYHLAEALGVLGRYLRTGDPQNVVTTLERHAEYCRMLFGSIGQLDLEMVGETVEITLSVMARASIWFNTARLSEAARQFVAHLTDPAEHDPVSELWWSQREALSQSLLDPYKVAIGIQMPTSAGKTLLAEFSIVQTLALNPGSTVGYVVPTRALVNQITRRLRADLQGATVGGRPARVESAVPVFELDPTENTLLAEKPDILITTPEKLDLLVRSGHPSVAQLSLIVVDEAHHISDADRGPRLELLLATLKRERGRSCRFLLLTPFLPNARELAEWLGDNDNVAISLDWTPSEQLRALGHWRKQHRVFHDVLQLVPSVTQPHVWESANLDLGASCLQPANKTRSGICGSIAIALSSGSGGGTLILSQGPGTAEKRAQEIARLAREPLCAPDADRSLVDAAVQYIRSELGDSYPLVSTLPAGVAFHHAGLPPEVRALVEVMLERGCLRVVAGTTTLAQGVNFPLAAVVVETLRVRQGRGRPTRPLRFAEFWNIAGRAGRALKDPVGLVVYPSMGQGQDNEFLEFLRGEAISVVSALADVFSHLDQGELHYGLQLVRDHPTLSHFLQYLAHALRVAGFDEATAEIEDILRSSLAFFRLRREDRATAQRLIRWSRGFLSASRNEPLLGVADVTGLSLPSVGLLSGRAPAVLRDPEYWQPAHLFGDDLTPLTRVVELLAELPELSLAPSDEEGGINARRVAGIVRDWVVGRTLPEIAEAWFGRTTNEAGRLLSVGRYLFRELTGQIPWGMGALQLVSIGADRDDEPAISARRAPAMAFYGVREPGALSMRMVGVPRAAAAGLGRHAPQFTSFAGAREWIAALPIQAWTDAARQRGADGAVLRRVWVEVGGSTA